MNIIKHPILFWGNPWKRRSVGNVYAYRSDDSGVHAHLDKQKIVKLKNIHVHVHILSVGEVHTCTQV